MSKLKRMCTACKKEHPLSNFYKSKLKGQRKFKIASTCKPCNIQAVHENQRLKAEYYANWLKKYLARPEVQERIRAYRRSPRGKAVNAEKYKFWRADPEKVAKKRLYDRERYRRLKLEAAVANGEMK